jgi:hypothetical protein
MEQDSSVSTVSKLRGGPFPAGATFSFPLQRPDRLWDPPNLFTQGVKWQEREAHHSPTAIDEVKNC